MKFKKRYNDNHSEDNIFWASMSDLLLGLLIVFIALFCLAMVGFTKQNLEKQSVKQEIIKELTKKFEEKGIPVEIDKVTGNIKISDLELFELNKWNISNKGKKYLDLIIPVYFDTILSDKKIRKNISNIIIEGHTDSQTFKNILSEQENYVKNLDLSMKRACSVTEYIVKMNYKDKEKYNKELLSLLSTNGRSYSVPVYTNNKEDYVKSRRVELKFELKDFNVIELLRKNKIYKE
jgi:chemotaxis protein MotB